jgi:hypothetical protein
MVPFRKYEMDAGIKAMLVDCDPGPNGFNGRFFKKCRPIIQKEFTAFHGGNMNLQNINGAYITLVPKVSLVEVNDFWPISQTNVFLKFLTKLAATKLKNIILDCIHKNPALRGHLNICICVRPLKSLSCIVAKALVVY